MVCCIELYPLDTKKSESPSRYNAEMNCRVRHADLHLTRMLLWEHFSMRLSWKTIYVCCQLILCRVNISTVAQKLKSVGDTIDTDAKVKEMIESEKFDAVLDDQLANLGTFLI